VSAAEVPLLAPVAGEIVEWLVSPGQVAQAGASQCFTISNPEFPFSRRNPETARLWVQNGKFMSPVTARTDARIDAATPGLAFPVGG